MGEMMVAPIMVAAAAEGGVAQGEEPFVEGDMRLCHICENETEWTCRDCGEPVCEDCCVPFTLHNQIDYTLCTFCHDGNETVRSLEYSRMEKEQEKEAAEKEDRRRKRRANYLKPENVEKRRIAREERKRLKAEQKQKLWEATARIVGSMFRGA